MINKVEAQRERKWAAENALSTLTRAVEIKSDTRLMADVRKLAVTQSRSLANVAGTLGGKTKTKAPAKKAASKKVVVKKAAPARKRK